MPQKILQIQASLFGDQGASSQLARTFVQAWRLQHPEDQVRVRDLSREPVPHLTAERFTAFLTPEAERTPAQREVVAYSDALIGELQEANVIVLGLPMYNFSLPSTLKAYFDHVARAGVTFRYTEQGPEGLLQGKKAYVLAARGGQYRGTPLDTQTDLVRHFLSFLGIRDVEFIYAEGLALGPQQRAAALTAANADIERVAA